MSTDELEELEDGDEELEEVSSAAAVPRRKRNPPIRFGWCIDGLHDRCLVVSATGVACTCECDNHGADQLDLPGASPAFEAIIRKYSP